LTRPSLLVTENGNPELWSLKKMSQKTTETSTITVDPLLNHVTYCCLNKEERGFVVTNLMAELSLYLPHAELFSPSIFTIKTWEALLKLMKQGEIRNYCYTRLLDCGASFSDGTDGIEWGAAMGLSYHDVPATRILALRRSPSYCAQQLSRFREHIETKKLNPAKINEFWRQLQRQLTMIVNSAYAIGNPNLNLKRPAEVK
jgi:hypothetical protein